MSHVVRHWLQTDDNAQAIIVDSTLDDPALSRFFAGFEERLRFINADVRDRDPFDRLSTEYDITHVVHGAAVTSINRLTRRDDGMTGLAGAVGALETNVMGTALVLAWADRLKKLRRFIYAGTGSVYAPESPDDSGAPLSEDGPIEPDGLYGLTKLSSEMLTLQCKGQFELPAVCVRFSSVFGPMDRETPSRAVSLPPLVALRKALAGEPVKICDPEGAGDFIYAPDVARAICVLLRAQNQPRQDVYNIAYGKAVTTRKLIEMVAGFIPGTRYEVVPPKEAEISLSSAQRGGRWGAYDICRLRDEFAWHPRPLPVALEAYAGWLRENTASEN